MSLEDLITVCLALPETEQTTPFGADTLVFKVCGKMFAASGIDAFPVRVNLKCDPDRGLELRDEYEAVQPGYHMNKKHWNTVELDGSLSGNLIGELILDSYKLVVSGLKKVDKVRVLAQLT